MFVNLARGNKIKFQLFGLSLVTTFGGFIACSLPILAETGGVRYFYLASFLPFTLILLSSVWMLYLPEIAFRGVKKSETLRGESVRIKSYGSYWVMALMVSLNFFGFGMLVLVYRDGDWRIGRTLVALIGSIFCTVYLLVYYARLGGFKRDLIVLGTQIQLEEGRYSWTLTDLYRVEDERRAWRPNFKVCGRWQTGDGGSIKEKDIRLEISNFAFPSVDVDELYTMVSDRWEPGDGRSSDESVD